MNIRTIIFFLYNLFFISINLDAQITESIDISDSIKNSDIIVEGGFLKNINDNWRVKIGKNNYNLFEFEVFKLFKGELKSDTILIAVIDMSYEEYGPIGINKVPFEFGTYFLKSDTITEFKGIPSMVYNYKQPILDTAKLKKLINNKNIGICTKKIIYEQTGFLKLHNIESTIYLQIEKQTKQKRRIIKNRITQDANVKEWLINSGNNNLLSGKGICYRFNRVQLLYNTDKLYINIEAKSSNWSTYYQSGKFTISYNPKAFGDSAVIKGNIKLIHRPPGGNNRAYNSILKDEYNIRIKNLSDSVFNVEIEKKDTSLPYRGISYLPMDNCHKELCEYYPLFYLEFRVKDINQSMRINFIDSLMFEQSIFYDHEIGVTRKYDYIYAKDKRDEIISYYKSATVTNITPSSIKPGSIEVVTIKGHHFKSLNTSILLWCTKDGRSFFMYIPMSNIISCNDDEIKFKVPENINGWKLESGHGVVIFKQFEQEFIESEYGI